jgi:hypothetical protein
MLRTAMLGVLALAFCTLTSGVRAEEKKADEKKLTGSVTCAKCDLGEAKGCATVIVVTEKKDGKDVKTTYYFDKTAHGKYHGDTCKASKEGTVKGEVKKDGDKMVVTVKDLEYKK